MTESGSNSVIRAAIYARISEDPRSLERGVSRQREDCEALVKARGWELVEVFTDNDISALRGKSRPGYSALMEAATAGKFDQIVSYGLSRLWRNRRERADAIAELSAARVGVALVKGSDLDLTSAAGRMYAGILGEFDTAESETKAERVARASQQRAEEGKANGAVSFGWRRVRTRDDNGSVIDWHDVEDPEAADVVRSIVADLLAGKSMNAVTRALNESNVPTPQNRGRWLDSTVRKIALRPSNAGIRIHRGREIGPGEWPAIVDRDDHDRIVALLTDPARSTTKGGARRHMLSFGIGKCGKCDGKLRVVSRAGHTMYCCDSSAGCVGRRQAWVDDYVAEIVTRRLARPDARELFARDDAPARAARDRADAVRARLDTAADQFADGGIDGQQLARITAKLRPELEAAEAEALTRVEGVGPALLAQFSTDNARAVWDGFDVNQRRAVLMALGVEVVVLPARGGAGFKPESVRVTPWQELPTRPS